MKVIEAGDISVFRYLKRIWHYRSLIRLLAIRDLKIKYSQTLLGLAWVVIQPIIAMFIYSLFFYKILGINTGNIPYPLFVFTGIMGWFMFISIMNTAGSAIVENRELIKRVEFPKLILLFAKCLSALLDFGVSLILLIAAMLLYRYAPSFKILMLPLFIILNLFIALTVGIWLAALTVRYRDFFHIIPYLINFGIWVTPVFYPTTILPSSMNYLMYLNPMAGLISAYRWVLLDMAMPSPYYLIAWIPSLLIFLLGLRFFIRTEQEIVDHI